MHRLATLTLLISLLALAACEQKASTPGAAAGNVAVIDVDRIVQDMGWNEALGAKASARANELANQLRTNIRRQLDEVAARFGPMPNKEQMGQLDAYGQQAQMLMQQAPMQAQAQARMEIESELMRQITPAAQIVANSRGFGIVMFRQPINATFMVTDPALDITDAVIAELKKTNLGPTGPNPGPSGPSLTPGTPGTPGSPGTPGTPGTSSPLPDMPFPINPTTRPATRPATQAL